MSEVNPVPQSISNGELEQSVCLALSLIGELEQSVCLALSLIGTKVKPDDIYIYIYHC